MTQSAEWRKLALENKERLFNEHVDRFEYDLISTIERCVLNGLLDVVVRVPVYITHAAETDATLARITARGCKCTRLTKEYDVWTYVQISWDHA